MKRGRNLTIQILIITSIVLLVALQFFWLQSAYNDAAGNFRRETNILFRSTIMAMHDSLVERSIEPLARDSSFRMPIRKRLRFDDSLFVRMNTFTDSGSAPDFKLRESRVEVFIASDQQGDSLPNVIAPLVKKIHAGHDPQQRFIIRLAPDSLRKDSIEKEFHLVLARAGINAPFIVHTFHAEPGMAIPMPPKNKFMSEVVRLNPMNRYAVEFAGIRGLLLQKITPQILFSIFLTLLTAAAFVVMYRSLRSQQKLMEIKNDFISNVTHELKTPVATVSVALEALRNFNALDNPQRTREYLDIAQAELNRLTLMTDKILKTSVFENQTIDLKFEKVNLDELVQQVAGSMQLVFEKKKTQFQYTREGLNFVADGNTQHLSTVLYNLIDNALKYSGDHALLHIVLRDEGTRLKLTVRDSGIGIPSEYQKKIFEKFFRVPSGDVHTIKGYGLGLSYVASVVKSHRGTIDVHSEPGKGSSFTITLPSAS